VVSSQGFSTKTQCSVLWSFLVVKETEGRGERERARARGRVREIQRDCGGAGGKSRSSVQSPFASRKSLCTVFFFFFPPTGFSALTPGTYLFGLLFFISFFLQRVCVCVCFIGGQLFCRGIAKHHELVI
jgi:hypothetical protein